jgi:hypothetical protein
MLKVTIPTCFTESRKLGGIPLPAALILGIAPLCSIVLSGIYFGILVALVVALFALPTVSLLWVFCAYQTKKDARWGAKWAKHLKLEGYYRA